MYSSVRVVNTPVLQSLYFPSYNYDFLKLFLTENMFMVTVNITSCLGK